MANPVLGVLLADDDALVRAGLRTILSAADDLRVVGEAGDGTAAIAGVAAYRPDVVLMDVRMPGLSGIDATERITALRDPPRVIVLTTFQLDEYVFGALRAGASGFLLKDTPPVDIIRAIRLIAAGEAMLSPSVTRTLIERFGADPTASRRAAAEVALRGLTAREREVAAEVALGRSNAEIASRLFMSEATVKGHVSRVMAKLGGSNRVQVAIVVRDANLGNELATRDISGNARPSVTIEKVIAVSAAIAADCGSSNFSGTAFGVPSSVRGASVSAAMMPRVVSVTAARMMTWFWSARLDGKPLP